MACKTANCFNPSTGMLFQVDDVLTPLWIQYLYKFHNFFFIVNMFVNVHFMAMAHEHGNFVILNRLSESNFTCFSSLMIKAELKHSYVTRGQKWLVAQNPVSHNEQAGQHRLHNEQSFEIPTCPSTAGKGWDPCQISTIHPCDGTETVCMKHLVQKNDWNHRNAQNLHVVAFHLLKWRDWGKLLFRHG